MKAVKQWENSQEEELKWLRCLEHTNVHFFGGRKKSSAGSAAKAQHQNGLRNNTGKTTTWKPYATVWKEMNKNKLNAKNKTKLKTNKKKKKKN